MATTKRPTTIGKEKGVPPSSPSNPNTTIDRKTTITKATTNSPLNKSISPSLKQTPGSVKPTLTSHSRFQKQSKTSTTDPHASQTETLHRRRHFIGKTQSSPSSSSPLRQKQPPPPSRSRLQNALLSPGPRLRAAPAPLRPADAPSPLSSRRASIPVSSKPITNHRTSKTVARVVKTPSLQNPRRASSANGGVIPKRSGVITSNKKVIGGGPAPATSTKGRKSAPKRVSFEAAKQEEKVEDDILEVENICEIEDVNFLTRGNDILLEEEKVISTVEEEKQTNVGLAEQEREEEKREEADRCIREEQNTKTEEISNNESRPEDQAATEAEQQQEQRINVPEENHNENLQGDNVNAEEDNGSNKKVEESITVKKQHEAAEAAGSAAAGKMERNNSSVSNGLIEETACRLQETSRRNKVRALAGAFQTVIDHQTN